MWSSDNLSSRVENDVGHQNLVIEDQAARSVAASGKHMASRPGAKLYNPGRKPKVIVFINVRDFAPHLGSGRFGRHWRSLARRHARSNLNDLKKHIAPNGCSVTRTSTTQRPPGLPLQANPYADLRGHASGGGTILQASGLAFAPEQQFFGGAFIGDQHIRLRKPHAADQGVHLVIAAGDHHPPWHAPQTFDRHRHDPFID